jgi:MFS family permease
MLARTVQVLLLFGCRCFCQANRLVLGGLMPLISRDLNLSMKQQGSLLSSFSLGYLLTQIIGGVASDRFGGKPVMALALYSIGFGTIVFSFLDDYNLMWGVMFFMGLLEGPSYPTNRVVLSSWIPVSEKASATALADAGSPVGALVALLGTPILADQLGWRFALLVLGVTTHLFALLWSVFAASDFHKCRRIAPSETAFLERSVSGSMVSTSETSVTSHRDSHLEDDAFPWKILTIPTVWAVCIAHAVCNYNRYLLYNFILMYYTDFRDSTLTEAAACMFWPTVIEALGSIGAGRAADALSNRGYLKLLNIRRIFSTIAFIGTGVASVYVARVRGFHSVTACVTVASAMEAFHNGGFRPSYADLTDKYGGFLMGIGNTVATGAAFLAPIVAASLLERHGGTSEQVAWRKVFGSVFVASCIGTLCYVPLIAVDSIDPKLVSRPHSETRVLKVELGSA